MSVSGQTALSGDDASVLRLSPAFADDLMGPHYIPADLSTPHARLNGPSLPVSYIRYYIRWSGHKSIVNTAIFHPHLPVIATSGVERRVRLHNATPSATWADELELTSSTVRGFYDTTEEENRLLIMGSLRGEHATLREGDSEEDIADEADNGTIALFDSWVTCSRFRVNVLISPSSLLREEEDFDVFQARRWTEADSDSEHEESENDAMGDI